MIGAEIQHFLGFANTTDRRTCQPATSEDDIERSHGSGFFRRYTCPTVSTGDLRRKPLFRSGPPPTFFTTI